MDLTKFDKLKDLHYLSGLEPEETRYARYALDEPSILATGHKFVDVYNAICSARAMLLYSFSENWGDIIGDDRDICTFKYD